MFATDFGRWVKKELFGGKGEVEVADLLGRREAEPFEAVLGCALAPGGSVGSHHQTTAHEVVICLAGKGVATVDGELTELVPGAVAYIRLGAILSLRNLSDDERLHYLIVKAGTSKEVQESRSGQRSAP